MAEEVTDTSMKNEENSEDVRASVKHLQSLINNHIATSIQFKISGKTTIKCLFTKYYKDDGKEELWPKNTFRKSYRHKIEMLECILAISLTNTLRPTNKRPHDDTELTYERNISDSDVERYLSAIGINDSTASSQSSSIQISPDSGRSTRSKRNTSQRDTMDETGNTSSSQQPPQQHHERVSISGITVDGGSSTMISTVENNISNNNGIGSNVSAITIMKSIRKRNTSQRDTTNGAANTSSSWPINKI